MATRGTQPCLETAISYFGTTVPSLVRVHEHKAIKASRAQTERSKRGIAIFDGVIVAKMRPPPSSVFASSAEKTVRP
jgi:hypothetical protein